MEKVIVLLRRAPGTESDDDAWCARLRGPVAGRILDTGLPGLTVNVKDADVRASLMTLTTLDPPVSAVVSLWTQQCYGAQVRTALDLLGAECEPLAAYLVTESVPMPPPDEPGTRTPGLANVALLRRPDGLDVETWRTRWHIDHTPVAIETQATFGYTQNEVVRALTSGAPVFGGDRRGAVPGRGGQRSQGVLRRGRRRGSGRSAIPDGGQHVGVRREREHRHRADEPLRAAVTVRLSAGESTLARVTLNIADDNRVRTLTLNRPEALNAFDEALYDATTAALHDAADDPERLRS